MRRWSIFSIKNKFFNIKLIKIIFIYRELKKAALKVQKVPAWGAIGNGNYKVAEIKNLLMIWEKWLRYVRKRWKWTWKYEEQVLGGSEAEGEGGGGLEEKKS